MYELPTVSRKAVSLTASISAILLFFLLSKLDLKLSLIMLLPSIVQICDTAYVCSERFHFYMKKQEDKSNALLVMQIIVIALTLTAMPIIFISSVLSCITFGGKLPLYVFFGSPILCFCAVLGMIFNLSSKAKVLSAKKKCVLPSLNQTGFTIPMIITALNGKRTLRKIFDIIGTGGNTVLE